MNRKKRYKVVIGSVCVFLIILGGTSLAAQKVINVWHTETNPLSILHDV